MLRIVIICLALATLSEPAQAEVNLFGGVIGAAIERAVEKAKTPQTPPLNCRPIRGRPQNDERCRMA